MSSVALPSFETVGIQVDSATSSTSSSLALTLSTIAVIIRKTFHFGAFKHKPIMSASVISLSVYSWMCSYLDASSAMSSAKSKSSSALVKSRLMPLLLPSIVFFVTQSTSRRNRIPDMTQPYFAPEYIF